MLSAKYLSENVLTTSFCNSSEIAWKTKASFTSPYLCAKKFLIPFRIFNYTLARFNFFAVKFSDALKKKKIVDKKTASLSVKRGVVISEDKITIEDCVVKNTPLVCLDFKLLSAASCLHVPSSAYFRSNELKAVSSEEIELKNVLNRDGKFVLKTEIEFKDSGYLISNRLNGSLV